MLIECKALHEARVMEETVWGDLLSNKADKTDNSLQNLVGL